MILSAYLHANFDSFMFMNFRALLINNNNKFDNITNCIIIIDKQNNFVF